MSRGFRLALLALGLGAAGLAGWAYRLHRDVARLHEDLARAERERAGFEERVEGERHRAEAARERLERSIEESRAREEALSRQLAAAANGELVQLRGELERTRRRLAALEGERAIAERIIRRYGAGVCLIQGVYAFYDAAGHPLRYRLDPEGRPERGADGSLSLGVDAAGEVHTEDFYGTGFLVDRHGLVLSNRHIAEPWWKDETAKQLAGEGFTGRLLVLRAFFPGIPKPFKLKPLRSSERADVAVLEADLGKHPVPALPLDAGGRGAVAGQPVIVVGYPTGLEAILAKTDANVAQDIIAAHGTASDRVTEALSRRGLIRPSTTQGHIGDITATDIVFDAPTTQGGSGGPVFNRMGKVIAVEYAVLPKFGGNAFGVPIRYALALLEPPKRR